MCADTRLRLDSTIYSALGFDWTTQRRNARFGRRFADVPEAGAGLDDLARELGISCPSISAGQAHALAYKD